MSELKPEPTMLGEKKRSRLKQGAKFDIEFLEVATRLVASGMTESDVAYFLGTTPKQIKGWKRRDKMFKRACEDGKELGLSYLIAQGLRAAAGYQYEEKNVKIKRKYVRVKQEDGTTEDELVEYPAEESTFTKVQPPNPNLLMFLVANISRQLGKDEEGKWISQHKIEVDENKNISVKIKGEIASAQIEKLAGAFLDRKMIDCKAIETDKKKLKGDTNSGSKA